MASKTAGAQPETTGFGGWRLPMAPGPMLGAAAAGGGLMLVWVALADLFHAEPRALLGLLANWGPLFCIALVLMLLGDRRIGELIEVNRDNAASQARMADAVAAIASKNDIETAEQRRLMDFIGSQMEHVLDRQERILRKLQLDKSGEIVPGGEME